MLYCSWVMVCDKCNYFSFWAIFCPFTPLTAQTIKILKKWKTNLEILSFYIYVPKIMTRWCMVPEILLFLILGSKFWKKWKKSLEIFPKIMCSKNYDQMMYSSWDMLCDGQTEDAQTEKGHIEVGAPPKHCCNEKCWRTKECF